MAVRTGGPGPAGLSVLVVPLKNHPGVTMRRLQVAGQKTGGTTYIELDDVKVPVSNLIGKEGEGMRIIMTNFNHERLVISVGVTRQARVALSAAFSYCLKREAFGKTLMDQPVVRHRLAKAGAELETMWAWVEQILYQLTHLSKEEGDRQLGGLTALAKAKSAMVLNECAQVAVLMFGGNGFTQTGQGELVEGKLDRSIFQIALLTDTSFQQFTVMFLVLVSQVDPRMSFLTCLSVSWSRSTRPKRRSLVKAQRFRHAYTPPLPMWFFGSQHLSNVLRDQVSSATLFNRTNVKIDILSDDDSYIVHYRSRSRGTLDTFLVLKIIKQAIRLLIFFHVSVRAANTWTCMNITLLGLAPL